MKDDTAVSEIIAVVMLIAIFAVAVGIVGVFILSNPPGDAAPAMLAHVEEGENGSVYLYHDGGDPLEWGHFSILVNGTETAKLRLLNTSGGVSDASDWTTWGTGQALVIPNTSPMAEIMIVADSVDRRGGSWLIFENGTAPTGTPTPVTTTVPTTTITTVPTTSATPTSGPGPSDVTANFTAAPLDGTAPLQVNFTDTSTGSPTSWSWDFGDNATSTEQNPTHTYTAAGTYTVSLTAAKTGSSDTETKTGYITVVNPTVVAGIWPMDEGTGSIVHDTSGNGNNGTITGATWISCSDRGYLVFDGTGDTVTIPNSETLSFTDAVSFEAWAYPTSHTTAKVVEKRDWDGHGIDLDVWRGWQGGVTTTTSSKTPLDWGEGPPDLNRWYYIALTYDGANLRLYVDGEEKSSVPLTGALKTNTAPIFIGSDKNTQKWFNGSIANVAVYGSALSPEEVRAHYAAFGPAGCPPEPDFTADVLSGEAPLAVTFTDLSTRHPITWLWDFGDNATSTEQNPTTHTYNASGTYTVSLTATNIFGSRTRTQTAYITVNESFIDYIIDENVFVYGNVLDFQGNTVTGPGATVIITGGLDTADLNGGASVAVSDISIDGDVTLDGGSAGLGSAIEPGNISINGDLTLGSGQRHIYGDVYVAGNFSLKDARIHGNVYVDGDLTLDWTPWLADDARIYYTGTFTHPAYMDPALLSKCIQQTTVPGLDMPDLEIPPAKSADWYAARGYVSGGALTSNMKVYADSYSSTSWRPDATNVVIIARTGDITITRMGGSGVTGIFFAPNGKVTFNGGSLEGVVIARDGFFVTSGGTTVTFKNIEEYISNPDDYPF
ncbi:MAG: hypothetical protein PWP08_67 [Methanofollis sp.]|nr:hypothetical protein [Methanofollis sp.]